jgi:hypothetical protein
MGLLNYAGKRVKDTTSFLNFLKALIKHPDPEWYDEQITAVLKVQKPPCLSKLQYLDLLRHCILCGMLPHAILRLAPAKQVTAPELWELIQLCLLDRRPDPQLCEGDADADEEQDEMQAPELDLVPGLLELPGARKLTMDQLLPVLQLALHKGCGCSPDGVVCRILALPAAGQIKSVCGCCAAADAYKHCAHGRGAAA